MTTEKRIVRDDMAARKLPYARQKMPMFDPAVNTPWPLPAIDSAQKGNAGGGFVTVCRTLAWLCKGAPEDGVTAYERQDRAEHHA